MYDVIKFTLMVVELIVMILLFHIVKLFGFSGTTYIFNILISIYSQYNRERKMYINNFRCVCVCVLCV
jgi:hypothetical protein